MYPYTGEARAPVFTKFISYTHTPRGAMILFGEHKLDKVLLGFKTI